MQYEIDLKQLDARVGKRKSVKAAVLVYEEVRKVVKGLDEIDEYALKLLVKATEMLCFVKHVADTEEGSGSQTKASDCIMVNRRNLELFKKQKGLV